MDNFSPSDPLFESRVRLSFSRQQLMASLGAVMTVVMPGEVHIELPYHTAWTQQNGYVHAGVITSIADSACGYAAYSLMPADCNVLSVEFKVNLLRPAKGELFIGIGRVIKPGRTLTVCSAEVMAVEQGERKLIALMQATMTAV